MWERARGRRGHLFGCVKDAVGCDGDCVYLPTEIVIRNEARMRASTNVSINRITARLEVHARDRLSVSASDHAACHRFSIETAIGSVFAAKATGYGYGSSSVRLSISISNENVHRIDLDSVNETSYNPTSSPVVSAVPISVPV